MPVQLTPLFFAVSCLFTHTLKKFADRRVLGLSMIGLLGIPIASIEAQTPTPVPVYTWRYDKTHAGQNTQETALTLANVNVNTFGKLFSLPVDSTVYAQPLYVPSLTMSDGLAHNVLFVATENDSIYAFDADSNGGSNAKPIWQVTLLDAAHGAGAGATAIPYQDPDQGDIGPVVGVTGTPVINPATNTLYVVSASKESSAYFQRLHAINIITGAEQTSPTSPVLITATVNGTGTGSSGGQLTFDQLTQNQRPALDFYNGYVYVGFASHGDNGVWHGWLMAYNAATMEQSSVFCATPNGEGAGIWGSGAGLPIDDDATGGRMFLVTGNGTVNTNELPLGANTEYGESIIDISLANGGLTPTDVFSSYNAPALNTEDVDQGSGGVLMIPDQTGAYPHILVESGKEGRILVLNRDELGGYNEGGTSNPGALQDITGQTAGLWSTPAYWNGNVYMWGSQGYPEMFSLGNGVLGTTPSSQSSIKSNFPGASFSISSNGTQNGIAWAVRSDQFTNYGNEVLYAWNATDLTNTIYESDTNTARDAPGEALKFSIPLVTNGKVYVLAHANNAQNGVVSVYGLLNGQTSAAAPTISPDGGTFPASQNVTLASTTSSAQIFYTLDGTIPTPASTLYSGPITISTDSTLKAIASAAGYIQSSVSSAIFNFSDQTPQVSFSPAAGTYSAAQSVTISDTDTNAKIYYTLDGTTPSSTSTLYTGPVNVSISETINAIAIDQSMTNSDIGTAAYVIQAAGSTINFANGFSSTTGLTLNGSTLADNDSRLQLTNGGLNEAGSVFWNTPINVQAFTTTFIMQLSNTDPPSLPANGMTFTIQNVGPTALGGDSAGLGYQGIMNSIAVKFNFYNFVNAAGQAEGDDSTGFYTGGEPPTIPTIDITPSGIQLAGGDSITATLAYNGTTLTLNLLDPLTGDTFTTSQAINIPQAVGGNTAYVGFTGGSGGLSASQKLTSWTYTTQAVPPVFTPPAGTYAAEQNIALTSATSDAVIYYTTNGTAPAAGSTQYSSPIAVDGNETIEAIAISPTMGSSVVESAAYVIQSPTPAFSMSASTAAAVTQGASTTSTVTIAPSGGFTGAVALTCAIASSPSGAANPPTCMASQPAAISGTTPVTSTLTLDTASATTAGAYTATVTGTSGALSATTTVALTVNAAPVNAGFALSGTPISIAAGVGSGTATITVTPSGGFHGTVAIACAVTSSPTGATDPPTCSATQPDAITGTGTVSSTLTVQTTGASTSALQDPFQRLFTLGKGGTLAAFVLLCLPLRRRKWQAMLGLILFLVIGSVIIGCGGSPTTTTQGSYTITVTGTSGSTTATTTVAITVQ